MAGLVCDIVTPAAKLYSGEAHMVVVPGVEGSMGFLHGHVPLVSPLADGTVRLLSEDGSAEPTVFVLQGGYVQVTGEKVIVLADRALALDKVDADAARKQLADYEAQASGKTDEELASTTLKADISWCKAQLTAVGAA